MESTFATPGGQRGPAEHERREQILRAADEHFRHYGYAKTTVADLAKAIGVSAAYVYRFFESKQAIGEAVCAMTLARFDDELLGVADDPKRSAADRLRGLQAPRPRDGRGRRTLSLGDAPQAGDA
jgi:AcrR family transcriptional regulator